MATEIVLGILSFTVIVNIMVAIILLARSQLVSTGDVTIEINDDPTQKITVPAGGKLLQTLAENNLFLSSACGGGGTCAQCRCQVFDGGGSIYLPKKVILIIEKKDFGLLSLKRYENNHTEEVFAAGNTVDQIMYYLYQEQY